MRNILGARARVTKRLGGANASAGGGGGGGGKGNTSNGVISFAVSEGPGGRPTGAGEAVEGEGAVEEEVVVADIRREDDFQGWLAQQKAGWRRHREESKLKRRSEARSQVQQQ